MPGRKKKPTTPGDLKKNKRPPGSPMTHGDKRKKLILGKGSCEHNSDRIDQTF